MALLPGFGKRITLTTDNGDVDNTLLDFPVMIYLSASSGRNSTDVSCVFDELTADANRKKIALQEDDDGAECYVEIEKWDDGNEKAWLHAKQRTVHADSADKLHLYYDVTHADNDTYVGDTNSVVAESVWDSNFKMVQHMADATTSTTYDSTTNDNDGTKHDVNEPAVTTSGKIANAQDFGMTDDLINCGSDATLDDLVSKTLEAWIYMDSWGESNFGRVLTKSNANTLGWQIYVSSTSTLLYFVQEFSGGLANWQKGSAIGLSAWYHIAVTYNSSNTTNNAIIYVNGADVSATEGVAPSGTVESDAAQSLYIGARNNAGTPDREFEGKIDEVRISGSIRTAAWIAASYESQIDGLLAFGAEETLYPEQTKTAAIDVLLRAQDSASAAVSIILKKLADNKDTAIDMYLKAQDAKTAAVDMIVVSRDNKTITLDSLLKGIDNKTVSLDTLVKALGDTKTAAVDALLTGRANKTVNLDALLKALGITKTAAVDILLQKAKETKTADVDVHLASRFTETAALDALLKALGVSKSTAVDVLLKKLADNKTTDVDVYIQSAGEGKTADVDVIVVSRDNKTASLDAVLKKLADNKQTAVDILLKELAETKTVSMDVMLAALGLTKTAAVDALLRRTVNPILLPGWTKNPIQMVIDHTEVTELLIDHPVPLILSTSAGITNADLTALFTELGANKLKLAVTTDDGHTQCYVEASDWEHGDNKGVLWAKIPSIQSGADTVLYLYFDNNHADNTDYVGATNTSAAENVWDSNFVFVSHMNDGADTSHIYDSTSNDNDGTKTGANNPIEATGLVGKAQQFSSDEIDCGNGVSLQITDYMTVESLLSTPSTATNQIIVSKQEADNDGWRAYLRYRKPIFNWLTDAGNPYRYIEADITLAVDTNYYTAWTYDGDIDTNDGVDRVKIYVDGASKSVSLLTGAGTLEPIPNAAANLVIGNNPANIYFPGLQDELRISNIARSAGHIATTNAGLTDALISYRLIPTAVNLDVVLKALDSKTAAIDILLKKLGDVSKTAAVDVYLQETIIKTADLDAILRATDSRTAAVDLMLKAFGVTKTTNIDAYIQATDSKTATLDAYISARGTVTIGIDILLAKRGADRRFILEVRQSDGDLICILKNAVNIDYRELINSPHVLRFGIKTDDGNVAEITKARELWIRDYETDTVVKRFKLAIKGDKR